MNGSVFDERIALNLTATTATSSVIGPGRLGPCTRANIRGVFGGDTSAGIVVVEWSHNQDFPGTPLIIDNIPWVSAGGSFLVLVDPKYFGGFIRLRPTTTVDGSGVTAWASGTR